MVAVAVAVAAVVVACGCPTTKRIPNKQSGSIRRRSCSRCCTTCSVSSFSLAHPYGRSSSFSARLASEIEIEREMSYFW
uniref:Putative secreted protein n=1 Tax=Anopheles darlingi TaxID=43151 RepID=A0A2M4D3K9_ANODA